MTWFEYGVGPDVGGGIATAKTGSGVGDTLAAVGDKVIDYTPHRVIHDVPLSQAGQRRCGAPVERRFHVR